MPNGNGEGVGATYLSEQGVLRLEKDVRVTLRETGALALGKKQDAPPSDVVLRGTSMEMGKQARKVVLAGPATATTATQQLSSGQMTVLLDEENRAQTLIAEPGSLNQAPVVVSHGGKGPTGEGTLRADLMTADLAPEGWVRTIEVQGNVQGKSESGRRAGRRGTRGNVATRESSKADDAAWKCPHEPARPEDANGTKVGDERLAIELCGWKAG